MTDAVAKRTIRLFVEDGNCFSEAVTIVVEPDGTIDVRCRDATAASYDSELDTAVVLRRPEPRRPRRLRVASAS